MEILVDALQECCNKIDSESVQDKLFSHNQTLTFPELVEAGQKLSALLHVDVNKLMDFNKMSKAHTQLDSALSSIGGIRTALINATHPESDGGTKITRPEFMVIRELYLEFFAVFLESLDNLDPQNQGEIKQNKLNHHQTQIEKIKKDL